MQEVKNLWVVMPVYNEEEALPLVVNAWIPQLRKLLPNFTLLILNDGSKDKTWQILEYLQATYAEIKAIDKPNSGHGQTCIYGYNYSLQQGADWIFQIDSDGQCDPMFFEKLLAQTTKHKAVYGFRMNRDDGFQRFLVSRVVSFFVFFATNYWIRDANVPYRLMHRSTLEKFAKEIPSDFHLSNILLAVLQKKYFGIKWVNIHFRDRCGGTPSVKTSLFAKHGLTLFKQLRGYVNSSKFI
jgi:dolichol-phosphate mannosyltransferase